MADYFEGAYLQRMTDRPNKPWRGVLVYTENGKRKQKTKVFGKATKPQATKMLELWRLQMEAEHAAPDASLSVAEYTRLYIDSLEKGGTVEASTIAGYRRAERKVAAAFSDISVRDLSTRPQVVTKWRDGMLDDGLSAVTVRKYLKFLGMIFKHAVAVRDVIWNPCDAVRSPKVTKKEVTTLEMGEIVRLITILDGMEPTPTPTAAYLALFAGLRAGEVCGLRWCDVDLESASLTVRQAVGVGKGGAYVKSTKTDRPRTVPISPELSEALTRRRDYMLDGWRSLRLSLGLPATDDAFSDLFVIGDELGGFMHPYILSREWGALAKSHGIRDNKGDRSTLHNLRHSFASVLIASGYDVVTVSQLLGHARPSMTLDTYSGAFEARKRLAAKAVAQTIGEAFAAVEGGTVVQIDRAVNE